MHQRIVVGESVDTMSLDMPGNLIRMGVNTQTVSYWEQGRLNVPPMARRYLDDLIDFPALWAARTGVSFEAK
jgi:hypothetical protein